MDYDVAASEVSERKTWYGPHACAVCGETIIKAAREDGGEELEVPPHLLKVFREGSTALDVQVAYPTTWKTHQHRPPLDPEVARPHTGSSVPCVAPSAEAGEVGAIFARAVQEADTDGGPHPYLFDTLSLVDAKRILADYQAMQAQLAAVTQERALLWPLLGLNPTVDTLGAAMKRVNALTALRTRCEVLPRAHLRITIPGLCTYTESGPCTNTEHYWIRADDLAAALKEPPC